MTVRNVVAHLFGLAMLGYAGFWLHLDVKPDGHVEWFTAAGVALLGFAGGFLLDKERATALLGFLRDVGVSIVRGKKGDAP